MKVKKYQICIPNQEQESTPSAQVEEAPAATHNYLLD